VFTHAHVDKPLSKRLARCDSSFMLYQLVRVERVNGKLHEHRPCTELVCTGQFYYTQVRIRHNTYSERLKDAFPTAVDI